MDLRDWDAFFSFKNWIMKTVFSILLVFVCCCTVQAQFFKVPIIGQQAYSVEVDSNSNNFIWISRDSTNTYLGANSPTGDSLFAIKIPQVFEDIVYSSDLTFFIADIKSTVTRH